MATGREIGRHDRRSPGPWGAGETVDLLIGER